ncbi:DMT family transporter [Actinoplanes sp. M2I2]|uniref:EamA family transporter n=1 Tax=Actinoplanes sp. M2I2 TaxID=1734444 RepID=UPI00202097A0|nr:EamA family transporter [Actinoplanes sp. M2I2]
MSPLTARGNRLTTRGPVALTVVSMASVQLGDAWSVSLVATTGAAGAAWLRAGFGAVLLLVLIRPRVRSTTRHQWRSIASLGAASAVLSLSFLGALHHLSLGTAVAIEFLGPLAVAVGRGRRRGLVWVVVALAGVLVLTQPWHGAVPLVGIVLAATSAVAWAACILLTGQVGRRVPGLDGVALAMPVAALLLTPWGSVAALGHLGAGPAVQALGLAALVPALPFVLETAALRRLPQAAFATLMSLEPAFAAVVGSIVLHQPLGFPHVVGGLLVAAAGAGAVHSSSTAAHRKESPCSPPPAPLPMLSSTACSTCGPHPSATRSKRSTGSPPSTPTQSSSTGSRFRSPHWSNGPRQPTGLSSARASKSSRWSRGTTRWWSPSR